MTTIESTTNTTNAIPAYLSADGADAVQVCTIDGCEVWAVRRVHGYIPPRLHDDIARPQKGDCYWTTVIQTAPGREKAMAFDTRRAYEHEDFDDRAKTIRRAVRSAVELLARAPLDAEDNPGDCIAEEYRGRAIAWADAGRVAYDEVVAAAAARRRYARHGGA